MTNKQIEDAFRIKYPDARYQIKTIIRIKDCFYNSYNDTYIVEFVDVKLKHPKVMELKIKAYEIK